MYKKTIIEGVVSARRSEIGYLVAQALAQHRVFTNADSLLINKRFILSSQGISLGEAEHYDDLLITEHSTSIMTISIHYYMEFAEPTELQVRKRNISRVIYQEELPRARSRLGQREYVRIRY